MGNPTSIKDRIIDSIECHLAPHQSGGMNTINRVITQGDRDIPNAEFIIIPSVGVYVKTVKGSEIIVPFPNIKNIQLKPETKGGLKPVA